MEKFYFSFRRADFVAGLDISRDHLSQIFGISAHFTYHVVCNVKAHLRLNLVN